MSGNCALAENFRRIVGEIYGQQCMGRRYAMPDVPPDPRAVIDARIHQLKKQSQKLNLESLEAEADLERAKQAVRRSRAVPKPAPTPRVVIAATSSTTPATSAVITIRPFADGVGYALAREDTSLWFDNEIHAINYAQDVFPTCEIVVLQADGTVRHRYNATVTEGPASAGL
jgi:hypothetical protein